MAERTSKISRRRAAARDDARSGYADRRREVVRAAAQVFKERGFSGTTLSHVAEAMGTDRASLYYYVSSKDELFQEIVTETVKTNVARAKAIRDGEGSAPGKLRLLIEDMMRSYEEHYPVLYVLIQENLGHVAPEHSEWARDMREINRQYEAVVIELVQTGQDDGSLRDDAPAWLVAYGIIGMVSWTNRWFNPNTSPVTAQEIGTAFADILLAGLDRSAS